MLSVVYEKNTSRLWWIHKLSNSKYKMMNLRHTHTHTLHRQAHIHMRMCTHLPTLNTAFSGKESACQYRRGRFNPWVGKIPWRSKWQPTPVFLPGKSHGQKSLLGHSPWGHKESDMIEKLTLMISFNLNYLPKHPVSKYSHVKG